MQQFARLLRPAADEKRVHAVRRVVHQRRQDVSVDVHRRADLRVSEDLHDDPRGDALEEEQGRG
jgi:hypothetical protein